MNERSLSLSLLSLLSLSLCLSISLSTGVGNTLATLHAGDYFGEAALLNNAPRGANVVAADASVTALYLDSTSFSRLFSKSKLNVKFAKRKGISAEQRNPLFQHILPDNAVTEKDMKVCRESLP